MQQRFTIFDKGVNMFYWFVYVLLWLPFRLFYPIKVVGKKNVPKTKPVIYTCNHYTLKDPVLLAIFLNKRIRFLAKKELFSCFLSRWILKGLGAFPVDRGKADRKAMKFCLDTLQKKRILGIFPEGTRAKGADGTEEIDGVKDGAVMFALKTGAPIVPMAFEKPAKMFRRNKLFVGQALYFKPAIEGRPTKEEIHAATIKLTEALNALKQNNGLHVNEKNM